MVGLLKILSDCMKEELLLLLSVTALGHPQMTPGFTGRGKFDYKSYPGSPLVALDGRRSIGK